MLRVAICVQLVVRKLMGVELDDFVTRSELRQLHLTADAHATPEVCRHFLFFCACQLFCYFLPTLLFWCCVRTYDNQFIFKTMGTQSQHENTIRQQHEELTPPACVAQ